MFSRISTYGSTRNHDKLKEFSLQLFTLQQKGHMRRQQKQAENERRNVRNIIKECSSAFGIAFLSLFSLVGQTFKARSRKKHFRVSITQKQCMIQKAEMIHFSIVKSHLGAPDPHSITPKETDQCEKKKKKTESRIIRRHSQGRRSRS